MKDIKQLWSEEAKHIPWSKKWHTILDWNEPFAKWFVGGKLNACYACLDAHMNSPQKNKIAFYWEDEGGNTKSISFLQLYQKVNKFASALKKIGVKKGDRIIIFLPMIPQAIISMLASARIGAIHSVVFSAFGAGALADRITDAKATFIITADYAKRRGKLIPLKNIVDKSLEKIPEIKHVIVVRRTEEPITIDTTRDCLYHEIIQNADTYIEPEMVEANHPLFILYTSGTTGKPKGIVHSTGGYLVYIRSVFKHVFNPDEKSIYWCTADIGWITGHSFVTYAPLITGTTSVIYEGGPDYPSIDIWWKLIEKYKVSIFYTSPTALRMFMRQASETIKKHNLTSLKTLGTVGEVINPEVWLWYKKHIGNDMCPIIDTWWQTETGGFMIAPSAKQLTSLKPGSATLALSGIEAEIVDKKGNPVAPNTKGYLVIQKPWPGMLMGVYNNPNRYKQVYWSKFPGMYYTGDYAKKDNDGYFWLLGRADEVMNIAGHLLGTSEIENAAIESNFVTEAAVVSIPDAIKGEAIILFATIKKHIEKSDTVEKNIIKTIRNNVGPIAKPKKIYFVNSLPKTRSGKIMRRILKAIATGEAIGDTSTLENQQAVQIVIDEVKKNQSATQSPS